VGAEDNFKNIFFLIKSKSYFCILLNFFTVKSFGFYVYTRESNKNSLASLIINRVLGNGERYRSRQG